MTNVYAFDVDDTLEIGVPAGPVKVEQLMLLKSRGHIVGLCGNYGIVFARVHGWWNLFSFWNLELGKLECLAQVKRTIDANYTMYGVPKIEHYVMVGNDGDGEHVSCDKDNAQEAGWEFVAEKDFREGL